MKDSFLLPRLINRSEVIDSILNTLMKLAVQKAWRVEISEARGRRTLAQNALLWVLYQQIIDKGGEAMQGCRRDEIHDFFLCNHFGDEIKVLFGRKKRVPLKRSSTLNKTEFSDFLNHIVHFMADQGVMLDMPEEESAW